MNQFLGQSPSLNPVRSADGELGPAFRGAGSATTPNPEQAIFHIDLRRSLRQHWRLARTVALGFAALAMVYVLMQIFVRHSWPTYQADSVVYVQPTPAKVLPSEGGPPRWPFDTNTYETYIQQQMTNVTRQDVLISAAHKIDGFQGPGESDQSAAQRVGGALQVTREGDAYQFTISARAGNPDMAAKIANAATAAYIESASRDERTGDAQRLAMLKEEKDRITASLTSDRSEQDALNGQLGVASISATVPDHYDEDITQIRTELVKARTDHDAAEAKFSSLDAGKGPNSAAIDAEADQMIATDAGLISMKTSLNARRAALISQMANLTPVNPQYKQDEAELVKINGDLDAMMKDLRAKAAARIQLQLRADLERTGGLESQLNGQLRQLVGSATSATPKLQRSSDLAADITRLQARYSAVDEQMHNIMLEDNAPAAAYQVAPAVPPLGRAKTGLFRNAALIVLAGLFFGLIAAIGAQKMDPHVYIAADVERVLGFAPLVQLPDFSEVSEGVAEEYLLRLASAMEHSRKQGQLKNCIFTGTGPETGVSTLVNRVRQMLEAMGRPTVLVDATGAKVPSTEAVASQPQSATGLVPMERVGSERLSRSQTLLQQVTAETDPEEQSLVLTDTAPLADSAETEYLARFVDCAIVVIESGVTTRTQLREAAATLQKLNVSAVGFVLNRVRLDDADPAFRQSIEAQEKRQQLQARNAPQRTERNVAAPVSAQAESNNRTELPAKEPAPRPMFVPEVAAAAAAVARFAPHAVSTAQDVCLSSTPATQPSPISRPLSIPLVETPAVAPAPAASPAAQAVPTAAPAPPPAVKTSAPFAEAARHFSSAVAANPDLPFSPRAVADVPIAAQVTEADATPPASPASPPAATPVPLEAEQSQPVAASTPPPEPDLPWWLVDTPRNVEPVRPPVLWQAAKVSVSRQHSDNPESWSVPLEAPAEPPAAEVPSEPPSVAVSEAPPAHLTSRLSGLRNLLFVLGVKDTHGAVESSEQRPVPASNFDSRVERTIPNTPADEPAVARGASPRLVTAAPEFLPPKPVVIEFDKNDPRSGEPWARQDRRDPQDRVEILPSKRGQYLKK